MPSLRYDVVLHGGRVIDGSGAPAITADVGVRDGRIDAVGDLRDADAARRLDVGGHVVTPGFVDVHSHDDAAVLLHPAMAFKVLQGVTTDVVGNCGMGAAPRPAALQTLRAMHPDDVFPDWHDYPSYLALLDREPPSLNVAVLVGHGAVRSSVCGRRREPVSGRELGAMRALVCAALDAGAVGLSSGLIYEPGRWADAAELQALAEDVAAAGGVYATHMRNEGVGLLDSVRETLALAEATGVAAQISHHKAAGRASWGRVVESLRLIEAAWMAGLDVTADQYPYTAGSTVLSAVVQNRGFEDERSPFGRLLPGDVRIASAPRRAEWEGKTLAELLPSLGGEIVAAAQRIVAEAPGTSVVLELIAEDDVRTVLRHPSTMIGSDGLPTIGSRPHPRLTGTFPRVLGRYVREQQVLDLEQAVHRMTGLPAAKFRLAERGLVRPGWAADLVVLDPATVRDDGTYDDPMRPPRGIRDVLVNGTLVVQNGSHTGARPGRCLRRG